ncbi:hypothetical protein HanRHA438_Chr05g0246121 [Helianthus annuus]|nr:hypothetical protein HanRHA438_Chr05g0246121 [Helianthus annuus]
MASNKNVVLVLETKRNPRFGSTTTLCLMSDNTEIAQCKYCENFSKYMVEVLGDTVVRIYYGPETKFV